MLLMFYKRDKSALFLMHLVYNNLHNETFSFFSKNQERFIQQIFGLGQVVASAIHFMLDISKKINDNVKHL